MPTVADPLASGSPGAGSRSRRVLIYATLVAVLQAAVTLSGLADGDLLSDDAFYYFQVARQAALGNSLSFDGVHPTNGFHPLWAWVLVPFYRLAPESAWGPIHAGLVLMGVCAAATGYVLYRVGRETASERAGELMAVAFFLSPFTWLLPQRGCGDALSVLCVASGAWCVARIARQERVTLRSTVPLGVLMGLAMLARTENILWAAPVSLWLLLHTRRLGPVILPFVVATLVLSPWLIWNLMHFGSIVQVSGAAKQAIDIYGRLPPLTNPLNLALNPYHCLEHSVRFVMGEEWSEMPVQTYAFLVLSAVIMLAAVVASQRARRPAPLLVIYGFLALHLLFYAYYLRHYFSWYFLPVAMCLAVFLGERLASTSARLIRATLGGLALLCAWSLCTFFAHEGLHPLASETQALARMTGFSALPKGSTVGVWNAGRMGYFATLHHPNVRVVNLDCLVNNELFAAFTTGGYAQWILREVDYLAEQPQNLITFLGEQPALAFYQRHVKTITENPPLYQVVNR